MITFQDISRSLKLDMLPVEENAMEGIQPTRFLLILATEDSNADEHAKITLSHLAPVYYLFKDMGADVVLTTLTGEYPEFSWPKDPPTQEKSVIRFIEDRAARDELADTLGLQQIAVEDFDAVFCLGTADALWDHQHRRPTGTLTSFLSHGKPVAIYAGYQLKTTSHSLQSRLLVVADASDTPLATAQALMNVISHRKT